MTKALEASLRVTLIYAVFAAIWILFSDIAVGLLVTRPDEIHFLQTAKGWFFVAVTAALLFTLVLGSHRQVERYFKLDALTGLLNHHMFKIQLDRDLAASDESQRYMVCYLDVDHFGEINQRNGYDVADNLLVKFASELRTCFASDTLLARFPPDQFSVVIPIVSSNDMDSHINLIRQKFRDATDTLQLQTTCSIGVAFCPDDGTTGECLMDAAQAALARAKVERNTVVFHDKKLAELSAKRRELLIDLQVALNEHSFSLVYQPQYELTTSTLAGVEVLIRWRHPQHGFISPEVFIPLAEENGLAGNVSAFVVAQAAKELGQANLLDGLLKRIAINISASEFNKADHMDDLLDLIKQQQKLAPYVYVEITETATLQDMRQSAVIINKLREHGIGISIDDFGTGYTSLAMLKEFAIDEIKIDRSFVADLSGQHHNRAKTIVEAIIGMARSFKIHVVAEGVETNEQLEILRDLGCQEAQGYFLGVPMDIVKLQQHLAVTV